MFKQKRAQRVVESQIVNMTLTKTRTRNMKNTRLSIDVDIVNNDQKTIDNDDKIFRAYKFALQRCNEQSCDCSCKCHNDVCEYENDTTLRMHTRGHRVVSRVVVNEKTNTRERIDVVCHDIEIDTQQKMRFHKRIANDSHKRAHHECYGHTHNRK